MVKVTFISTLILSAICTMIIGADDVSVQKTIIMMVWATAISFAVGSGLVVFGGK